MGQLLHGHLPSVVDDILQDVMVVLSLLATGSVTDCGFLQDPQEWFHFNHQAQSIDEPSGGENPHHSLKTIEEVPKPRDLSLDSSSIPLFLKRLLHPQKHARLAKKPTGTVGV